MSTSDPSSSSESPGSAHTDSGSRSDEMVFDQRLKDVLLDVEVPAGLKQSVLDALDQQQTADSVPAAPTLKRPARFHRRPGTLVGLSLCLLLTAVLTFFWAARQSVIPLAEFSPELNLDSRLLPEFDQNFSLQLPVQSGWQTKGRLVLMGDRHYGLTTAGATQHDAAVGFFQLRVGNGHPIFVALIQVPASRLETLPAQTRFNTANVEYAQLQKGNYATVKWVEDDQVYICIVYGGPRELETLGRALHAASA